MLLRRIRLYINLRLITILRITELETTEGLDALLKYKQISIFMFVSLCFNLCTTQYDDVSV